MIVSKPQGTTSHVWNLIRFNPLTPVLALTVTTFDQNWHHPYSTSAGGKYISNDAKIRVIGLMAAEICTKMLKKLSEKPDASGQKGKKFFILQMTFRPD